MNPEVSEVQLDRAGLGGVARHAEVLLAERAGGQLPRPAWGGDGQVVHRIGPPGPQSRRTSLISDQPAPGSSWYTMLGTRETTEGSQPKNHWACSEATWASPAA